MRIWGKYFSRKANAENRAGITKSTDLDLVWVQNGWYKRGFQAKIKPAKPEISLRFPKIQIRDLKKGFRYREIPADSIGVFHTENNGISGTFEKIEVISHDFNDKCLGI